MMLSPGSGDLAITLKYGHGLGNSTETHIMLEANQGIFANGKDVGTNLCITIFGEWERDALHTIIDSKYTRACAVEYQQYLKRQLSAFDSFTDDEF